MKLMQWAKKASLKLKLLILIIIIALGWFGYTKIFAAKSTAPLYQTQAAEKKTLLNTTSVTGNISSTGLISVATTTTGVIEEIYVKNGDTVKAGDALFKVKSTATPDEIATAYAAYLNAQNAVKTAELTKTANDVAMWKARDTLLQAEDDYNYKNNNSTNRDTNKTYTDLEKQIIDSAYLQAQKEWTAAQEKYNQSDTSITVAKAQLNAAWIDYQATQTSVITTNVGGTIANLSAKVGDYVTATSSSAANSSNSNATPILYIGNFSNAVIAATANEVDLPKLKVGQKATVTMDAFTDKTFAGEISHIDTIGTNSSGVVTYNVYISLLSVPPNAAPGMSASATIQIDRKDDALVVPSTAIQTINGQTSVQIMKADKTIETRNIQTGMTTDTETEIVSGVQAGELVVTGTISMSNTSSRQTGTSPFTTSFGTRGGAGGGQQIRIVR